MSKYRFVVILAKTVLFVSGTNYLPITKYSTHVLELVRNNGKSSEKENMDGGFLMFDHFKEYVYSN